MRGAAPVTQRRFVGLTFLVSFLLFLGGKIEAVALALQEEKEKP